MKFVTLIIYAVELAKFGTKEPPGGIICHLASSFGTKLDTTPSNGRNLSPSILYENNLFKLANDHGILNF